MDLRGSELQAIAGLTTREGAYVDIAAAEGLDHALLALRAIRSGTIHTQSHSASLVDAALAGGRTEGRGLGDLGDVHAALPLQVGGGGRWGRCLGLAQLEHAALALLQWVGGQQLALSLRVLGHVRSGCGLLEPG